MRMPYPSRADLVEKMPLSARSVLFVGCGEAALAAEYRRRNPRAILHGVERDPAALALAAQRLDRLFAADIEQDPAPFAPDVPPGGYDCILYAGVLERLHAPWLTLARQARALAPDGVALICIPNPDHWALIERMLRGTEARDPKEHPDRLDMRCFALDAARRAIAGAGLHVVDIAPRGLDFAAAQAFREALAPALQRMAIDPAGFAARTAASHHLLRARPRAAAALAVVSTRLVPVGGVSEVRVTEPMRALLTEPGLLPMISEAGDPPPLPADLPRIFVLHRPALEGERGLEVIRGLLRRGWLVVCEFDDHPDCIPAVRRDEIYNFLGAHAVQTSTETLADLLRAQNPEVAVFPNAIARLAEPRNYAGGAQMALFFGGLNRESDWPALLPGLNRAAARLGDRLRFVIVNDQALFNALQTPRKSFHPLCDYETYKSLLGGCEISFMPLADTPFNRCKSDLKFLEASAHRVTTLASRVVYADSVEDGRTGLLFSDADELEHRLVRLVASPAIGRSMADAARAYVAAERMLAYQTARRADWYRSLWRRRDELRAALMSRLPALAAEREPASPAAGA